MLDPVVNEALVSVGLLKNDEKQQQQPHCLSAAKACFHNVDHDRCSTIFSFSLKASNNGDAIHGLQLFLVDRHPLTNQHSVHVKSNLLVQFCSVQCCFLH